MYLTSRSNAKLKTPWIGLSMTHPNTASFMTDLEKIHKENIFDKLHNRITEAGVVNISNVDVIISSNIHQKVLFIFNDGFPNMSISRWITNCIKQGHDIYELCCETDVKEFIFWDGLTSQRKAIRFDELIYLMRA